MKKRLLFVAGMATLVGNIYSTEALALTPIKETVAVVKERWKREVWDECAEADDGEMCRMAAARRIYDAEPSFFKVSRFGNAPAVITEVDIERQKIKLILSNELLSDIPSRRPNPYPDFTNFSVAGPANKGELYWRYNTDGREKNSLNDIFYDWKTGDEPLIFGREIEIDASGTRLLNGNNNIYTLFRDIDQYLLYDIFDYSDCVNSPEFREGMVCRGYLEERFGEIIYLPAEREEEMVPEVPVVPAVEPEGPVVPEEPTVPEEPVVVPEEPIVPVVEPEEPVVEPEEPVVIVKGPVVPEKEPVVPEVKNDNQEIKNEAVRSAKSRVDVSTKKETARESAPAEESREEDTSSDEYVSLPLTRGEGCYETIKFEFLWWLIALILVGDALIMWWFWPEKSKNNLK